MMSNGKIPCSVGILTFNSAASLRRCLESVKNFDDVVICDGGSTDETLSIAREYACRIIEQNKRFKNPDNTISDFSGIRNQQLHAAAHDWFMYLDSDEYISEQLEDEIGSIVLKNDFTKAIFLVPRKYVKDHKVINCATTYPNYQIRFFNRNAVKGFVRSVHERVEPKEGFSVAQLRNYEYVPLEDIESIKKKWVKYLRMELDKAGTESLWRWFFSGLVHHAAISGLYCFRYLKISLFCRGTRMPIEYELLRLWYNFEVVKIGFLRVIRKRSVLE